MTEIKMDMQTIIAGHHKTIYRGVPCVKCPFDYVIYQMIIEEVRPDLIIEIGTYMGGAALYMADLMNNIGNGMVHTIDIADARPDIVKKHPRIKFFGNGWKGYDLNNAKGFNRVLVIDDGSHFYEDCLGAMNKFAPLVSSGNYLIVEDSIVGVNDTECFRGSPLKAINEFIAENKDFKIDRKWCDFFGMNATFNVEGYLKKC